MTRGEKRKYNELITSVSIVSLSLSELCGLIDGGGGSIAAAPFFFVSFFAVKNDPKKLCSSFFRSTSRSLLLLIAVRSLLPSVFGGGPFAPFRRSATMAVACRSGRFWRREPFENEKRSKPSDHRWNQGASYWHSKPAYYWKWGSVAPQVNKRDARNHIRY